MNDAAAITIEAATQSTELVVIPAATLPQIVAADKDGILESLARKVAAFDPDISTPKGREACRSLAYEIARSKTKLDTIGKNLTEDQQKMINAVNAERRQLRERLEELQEQVRAPLTAWENAEKARVAAHEAGIATLESWADVPAEWTSAQVGERIAELGQHELLTREWQEFAPRAQKASKAAYNALKVALADARLREAAEAEAARVAAEEAERQRQEAVRQQQEREAEIARQAAERARVEAEARAAEEVAAAERHAQAEREAAALREKEAKETAERAERQRQEAEERATRQAAEAEAARVNHHRARIEAIEQADRFRRSEPSAAFIQGTIDGLIGNFQPEEFEDFAAEAEQARDATLTRLRAMLAEAQDRERRQAETLEQERQRQADAAAAARLRAQQDADRAEQEKRAANKAHRQKINLEALDALKAVIIGFEAEAIGRAVITAIAKGAIPHIEIRY